jgi:hypothetical protein
MLTFEEYCQFYYKNNKFINSNYTFNNKLNDTQLKSKYEKYLKSNEKQTNAKQRYIENNNNKITEKILNNEFEDEKWIEICKLVDIRDNFKCRLKTILNFQDTKILNENNPILLNQIDHAHIIGKGKCPELKYDIDNIICLNRQSHSWIDNYRNPINGKQITNEERIIWWKKIIGEDKYNKLLEKTK